MRKMDYSVLMSVYYKENPEYLKEAMLSVFNQTIPTNDFVLICDGPLTEKLDDTIAEMKSLYPNVLNVVRMSENHGLGFALNRGLTLCKNQWVGRMDSDDISCPCRFEKQIEFVLENPFISICSAGIEEFGISKRNVKRILPKNHEEIVQYSKRRCPFNHPAVFYRKSDILASGGYVEHNGNFEDYPLWINIMRNDYKVANCPDVLVKMRVSSELYARRGGYEYAKSMVRFRYWMYKDGWSDLSDFIFSVVPHFIVCILPNRIRKGIYSLLRTK